MNIVQTYATTELAQEDQRLLAKRGIASKIVVDPLDGRYPALSHFDGVGLQVEDARVREAQALLSRPVRKAS